MGDTGADSDRVVPRPTPVPARPPRPAPPPAPAARPRPAAATPPRPPAEPQPASEPPPRARPRPPAATDDQPADEQPGTVVSPGDPDPGPGLGRRTLQWLLAKAPESDPKDEPDPDVSATATSEPAVSPRPRPAAASEPPEHVEAAHTVVRPPPPRPPAPRPAAPLPGSPSLQKTPAQSTAIGGVNDAGTDPEPPSGFGAADPETDARITRFLESTEAQTDEPDTKPAKDTKQDTKPAKDTKEEDEAPKRPLRERLGGKGAKRLRRYTILVVILVVAALLVRTYIVAPYYIPSESMEPTLHGCMNCNDDHVIVDKFSYRLHEPKQTDIVVFNRPPGVQAEDSVLIKRVIAVPGDTVSLRGGKVVVNGNVLKEPYLNRTFLDRECRRLGQRAGTYPLTGRSTWRIPDGQVFVMGDNRCDSMDSRAFGPISESSVVGRAIAIFWPLKRLRTL